MAAVDWALRRSYCNVSSCLMVAPLPSPFALWFILLLLLGSLNIFCSCDRSIVNNKLLVFAQPIEGGDNVGEIHTLLLQGNDFIRFTVRISSS
jgi:hypothetical protein